MTRNEKLLIMAGLAALAVGTMKHKQVPLAPAASRDVTDGLSYGSSTMPLLRAAPNISFQELGGIGRWSAAALATQSTPPDRRAPLPFGVGASLDFPLSGPGTRRL